MSVDLVGNEKLQRFIAALANVNHAAAEALQTGNIRYLESLQTSVKTMYELQNGATEEEYTAIDEDAQMIYKNFDGIVAMLQSNEGKEPDAATNVAVKKFLHNIFDANVRIIRAYGLV